MLKMNGELEVLRHKYISGRNDRPQDPVQIILESATNSTATALNMVEDIIFQVRL